MMHKSETQIGSLLDMEAHMPSETQNNSKKNKKKHARKEEYP